eukprot:1145214-Pelagomonas_calceolata.AAC.1
MGECKSRLNCLDSALRNKDARGQGTRGALSASHSHSIYFQGPTTKPAPSRAAAYSPCSTS